MKLSDLIKHIGDDNVLMQNVMHSSPDIKCGKKDGIISFSTDKAKAQDLINQAAFGERGGWTALVVWMRNEDIAGAEQAGSKASDDSPAQPHNSGISNGSP